MRHAIELFALRGFDGVSVRDVARAVGVTMPTLYHHFGDKRRLYLESCLWLFDQWGQRLGLLLEREGSPQQQLFDYCARLSDSLTRDRKFSSLLQRELLERDAVGIRQLTRHIFSGHFKAVVRLCRKLGCGSDAVLRAHTIYALTFGMAQLQPIGRELGATRGLSRSGELARHVLGVALPRRSWASLRTRR